MHVLKVDAFQIRVADLFGSKRGDQTTVLHDADLVPDSFARNKS
jgi:hypothetical protein